MSDDPKPLQHVRSVRKRAYLVWLDENEWCPANKQLSAYLKRAIAALAADMLRHANDHTDDRKWASCIISDLAELEHALACATPMTTDMMKARR